MGVAIDLNTAALLPALGEPTDPEFLENIKEVLELWRAERGDALDAVVTKRFLFERGLIDVIVDGVATPFGGSVSDPALPQGSAPGGVVIGPATKPTTVNVTAALANIILDWDTPAFDGFAHTEIWRATTNDLTNAALIATTAAEIYADPIGVTNTTRFYWIRHVNQLDQPGAFHAGATAGASDTTGQVVEGDVGTAAITQTKIGLLAVDNARIANATIAGGKIAVSTITAANISGGTITATEIASATLTADLYSELRNSQLVSGDDSVDATYPIILDFPILAEMTTIQSIKLSFKIRPFRGYTTSGSGGGGVVGSTVEAVGTHIHTFTTNDVAINPPVFYNHSTNNLRVVTGQTGGIHTLSTVEGHNHDIVIEVGSLAGLVGLQIMSDGRYWGGSSGAYLLTTISNGHQHKIDIGSNQGTVNGAVVFNGNLLRSGFIAGPLAGNVEPGPSAHSHTGGTHTHPTVFGIFEESNSPTIGVSYSNNGTTFGASTNYTTDQLELDITSNFSSAGWKAIRFTSTQRARITYTVELKLDITA